MRTGFLTVEMDDGSELLVQKTLVSGGGELDASADSLRIRYDDLVENTIAQVSKFAGGVKEKLITNGGPDEVELEFSVGFSGEAKAIIASSEVSTGMIIRLKWNLQKTED